MDRWSGFYHWDRKEPFLGHLHFIHKVEELKKGQNKEGESMRDTTVEIEKKQ